MNMKIILIDDEPPALRLLVQMLQKVAPQCIILATCSSLKEGIAAIQSMRPELVFLDIEMPRQKGIEITEFFDGELPFQVVFVTAYPEFAAEAFGLNATDYLLKPCAKPNRKKCFNIWKSKWRLSLFMPEQRLKKYCSRLPMVLKSLHPRASTS
jgi:two-component system LytT family response regulator